MMMLAVSDSGNEVSRGYQLTFQHFACQRTGLHTFKKKKKLQSGKKKKSIKSLESGKHIYVSLHNRWILTLGTSCPPKIHRSKSRGVISNSDVL